MSSSLGAYIRPNRVPLPTFSNGGNGYQQLNGGHKHSRKPLSTSRKLIRYCLIPGVILLFILYFFAKDAFTPPPPPPPVKEVDPFEQCEQVIADAGIPSAENITESGIFDSVTRAHSSKDQSKWAKVITADKLMQMLEDGENPGPRILHQSWKPGPLPDHFELWSTGWRQMLDNTWLYVLWRDADNRKLVERYYSKYLTAYDLLPREIYRADMVRNMYMHRFGGVYADLDLVALAPLSSHIPILKHDTPPPVPIAYLGHMGDDNYEHSIPNAFMVSTTPEHPFWLKPLDFVKEHQLDEAYNSQPEGLTGPVALRSCVKAWEKDREVREGLGEFADVRVLPNDKIYPFSWYDSPLVDHCLCRLHSKFFNETRCHYRYPTAWTVTYWTHSWGF